MEFRQGRGARIANLFSTLGGLLMLGVVVPALTLSVLGAVAFVADPPSWVVWAVGVVAVVVPLAVGGRLLRIAAANRMTLAEDSLELGRLLPHRVLYADVTVLRRGIGPQDTEAPSRLRRWVEVETPDLTKRLYLGDTSDVCFDELLRRCPGATVVRGAEEVAPKAPAAWVPEALRRTRCRRIGRCALVAAAACFLAAGAPFLTGGLPGVALASFVLGGLAAATLAVFEYRQARLPAHPAT